ncbi:pyruvate ferredoxin oxidoreductase [candidate division KSB1 bacterium]|jgi:indolepyruvate ferredoxin oxidoreductase beta subunit|nr:pyruvate ferredoxin oxidoreductase [candidate division KSB1 bacterium]
MDQVYNIVFAGLGGQGVIKASDILAEAAFLSGFDVKKAEVHGMSQRGGSVTSDVRLGQIVMSPMVPPQGADILVVLEPSQTETASPRLKPEGLVLNCSVIDAKSLPNAKTLNVAMLGLLSNYLPILDAEWHQAIRNSLPENLHDMNFRAFSIGKNTHL